MTRYYNKNSLIRLLPNKFNEAWNDIMAGRALYKTWDKRILDFGLFTEEQIYTKKERVGAIHSTRATKEAGYRVSHINRVNKRRSNRRRIKLRDN
uniref:Uncharacterized protein n=1 Tax=viral metagenome TaxID=1070528 RepID=A0A6M3LPK2_9ZZZZ